MSNKGENEYENIKKSETDSKVMCVAFVIYLSDLESTKNLIVRTYHG